MGKYLYTNNFQSGQQKFSSSSVRPNLDFLYKSFEYTILACEI